MMTDKTAINLVLSRECANKLSIPLIEVLKPFDKYPNAIYLLNLPPNSAFGNLTLSYNDIVSKLD